MARLDKLAVVPLLHPSQPCCLTPFERHYKSTQEFAHIIDFTAAPAGGGGGEVRGRVRYLASPQCSCYARGHLRALRVTAWTEEGSEDQRPLSINTPFPYHPAGSRTVFGELWFHAGASSVSRQCEHTRHEMVGAVAEIENREGRGDSEVRGDTLHLIARMVDYTGTVRYQTWALGLQIDTDIVAGRCEVPVEVTWHRKDLRDDEERAVMFSLACGPMEAGKWRLTVERAGVERPYLYEVDMLFLDLARGLDALGPAPDVSVTNLLAGMWRVDSAARLPLQDWYQDSRRLAAPFAIGPDSAHRWGQLGHCTRQMVIMVSFSRDDSSLHSRHRRSARGEAGWLAALVHGWVICSGGLVTIGQ